MIQSNTTGTSEAHRFIDRTVGRLAKKIPFVLQESGNAMIKTALSFKTYNTQSGQADRSIQADVDAKNWQLMFYVNPQDVTTSKGYNYVWGLHDGTGQGYKKSRFSPSVTPKRRTAGRKYDHFMVKAWDMKYKGMVTEIKKEIVGAFK